MFIYIELKMLLNLIVACFLNNIPLWCDWSRTNTLQVKSLLLYLLSYTPGTSLTVMGPLDFYYPMGPI